MTPDAGPARLDDLNPWPGLAPYDEGSSGFFYGRDQESAELLRLISLAPLTVVYGKSGLGKTSLLQAGLFPLLRTARYVPVYLRLDFSDAVKDPPSTRRCAASPGSCPAPRRSFPPRRPTRACGSTCTARTSRSGARTTIPSPRC